MARRRNRKLQKIILLFRKQYFIKKLKQLQAGEYAVIDKQHLTVEIETYYHHNRSESENESESDSNTAIVLCDEHLLSPLYIL